MAFKKIPDKDVRRLLRHLKTPKSLDQVTLAQAIREKTGHENTLHAVLQFLEKTFSVYGADGQFLFSLIKRADIIGSETQAGIAAALNLSTRQYYRYRSRAVHVIVRALDELFSDTDDTDPLEALAKAVESDDPVAALAVHEMGALHGRPDYETDRIRARSATAFEIIGDGRTAESTASSLRQRLRFRNHEYRADILFELAYRDFIIGRYRSDAALMAAAIRDMNANASSKRANDLLASICDLETSLRFDKYANAVDSMRATVTLAGDVNDAFLLETCSLRLSELYLSQRSIADARRIACAVAIVSKNRSLLDSEAIVLTNRVALLEHYAVPYPFAGEMSSHNRAMWAATWSRELLRMEKHDESIRLAQDVQRYSQARKYIAPLVWSLVTLGDTQSAWLHAATAGDRLLLADAFETYRPVGHTPEVLLGHSSFVEALHHGLAAQRRSLFKRPTAASMGYVSIALRAAVTGDVRQSAIAQVGSAFRNENIAATTLKRFEKSASTLITTLIGLLDCSSEREGNMAWRSARLHDLHAAIASQLNADNGAEEMKHKRAG